jgi:hypothetical protein
MERLRDRAIVERKGDRSAVMGCELGKGVTFGYRHVIRLFLNWLSLSATVQHDTFPPL